MNIDISKIAAGEILVITSDKNGRDLYTRVNSRGKWRISLREFSRVRNYPNVNVVVIDNRNN